jgi:hypothetical protein
VPMAPPEDYQILTLEPSRHTDGSGEEEWLGGDQHAKGLETHFPLRQVKIHAHVSIDIRSEELLSQTITTRMSEANKIRPCRHSMDRGGEANG